MGSEISACSCSEEAAAKEADREVIGVVSSRTFANFSPDY